MKQNPIITIGRQFGSGGHEIAKMLSKALSIPFYDKEIIVEAAKKSGIDENLFRHAEERTVSSFLYSIALGASTPTGLTGAPIYNVNEVIYGAQSKAILEFAKEGGGGVFVGRCADYVLRDFENAHHIFVYADLPARTERIAKLYDLTPQKAEDLIVKTDKRRANFYNYYTGARWSAAENYDLCINSAHIGTVGAKDVILSYLNALEA